MNKEKIYLKLKSRQIPASKIRDVEKESDKHITRLQKEAKIFLDLPLKDFVTARR